MFSKCAWSKQQQSGPNLISEAAAIPIVEADCDKIALMEVEDFVGLGPIS